MDFNERLMDFSNAGKPFRPDSTNLNTNKYGGETEMIEVRINYEEYQILSNLLLEGEQESKEAYLQDEDGIYKLIVLDGEKLDAIFERITELLQKSGFDVNYNPTYVGIILEGLIDKINRID
jgi:hypothetical protein